MPGNTILESTDFEDFAYKNLTQIKPGETAAEIQEEIEIRPYLNQELVAVTYLSYPTNISDTDDTVLFPKSMLNLIVDKALHYISWKQGDGTNLYQVTDRDISNLVQLMS